MKCAIHQPQFLPWLGYLHKISSCDVFVFLDNIQFKKNEYQNRNKIRIGTEAKWLTVPVSFSFGDTIRETSLADDPRWRRKMISTIEYNYRETPFFKVFSSSLFAILNGKWNNLADLNQATVEWLISVFEIKTQIFVASRMPQFSNNPTRRLIDICKHVGADIYLSGAGGQNYLDISQFEKTSLKLEFQEYLHPVYPQWYDKNKCASEFLSHLSAIDGLMNCGGGEAGKKLLNL
jgi:hypothetical protein